MAILHSVQTCRWGAPTLFLGWPLWYEASQYEWSCIRGTTARVLDDPAMCRTCLHWSRAEDHEDSARTSEISLHSSVPANLDSKG